MPTFLVTSIVTTDGTGTTCISTNPINGFTSTTPTLNSIDTHWYNYITANNITGNNTYATCTTNNTCTTSATTNYFSISNNIFNCTSSSNSSLYIHEIVIDEEDYMNHAEYFELARQRGIRFRIRTAEERRLADEELARQRAEAEARQAKAEAARLRAKELLVRHLTDQQRKTLERDKWFVVIGKSGTKYRIRTDSVTGNIDVMRNEQVASRLCCHCSCDIPNWDQFLAQKLALQYDEQRFLGIANHRAA